MNTFSSSQRELSVGIRPGFIYFFVVLNLAVIIAVVFEKPHYLVGAIVLSLFGFVVLNQTKWGLYLLPVALATPIIIVPGTRLHLAEAVVFFIFVSFLGYCALSGQIQGISFPKPYKRALILFFSASFLSLTIAPHPMTGLILIVKLALAFVVVFGLTYAYVTDRGTLDKMTLMIVVAGLIAAFYGIFQYYLSAGTLSLGQGPRIFGRAGGGYGAFIGIAIVISLSRLLTSKNISRMVLFLSFLPPLVLALLLSRTRAWILGTAIAAALVFLLWTYKKLGRNKSVALLLVLVLLSPVFLGPMRAAFLESFSFLFLRQSTTTPAIQTLQDVGELHDLSLFSRYRIWKFALHTFMEHPLTGIGVGNFRIKDALRPQLSERGSEGGWSDNHYVNILAETGILGVIAWIYLTYLLFSCCLRILRSTNEEYLAPALGLVAALVVFAVGGLFWNLTSALIDSSIFALTVSLVFSATKIMERNEPQSS
jgi:O-antigen ligase